MKTDPITLEVYNHRFAAIADEMGVALCRSAFSPNIKERRDFSCALFDRDGEMVAQAAHIPVHLGSTPMSVRAARAAREMSPGDVVVLNDPFAGGTHLPDVTVVAPVFLDGGSRPFAFVANRAHHADIGGAAPGSMSLSTEIYQEGLRLPPVHLVRGGELCADVVDLFLANTRVREERRGDLLAQLAALRLGATRLRSLVEARGEAAVADAMGALQDYSARLLQAALRQLPDGVYRAEDRLDDDGTGNREVKIRVAIEIRGGRAIFDFEGTSPQVSGGVNSNPAVTTAAVLYCLQLVAGMEIPANAGLQRPVRIAIPEGSLLHPRFPAAVAGGNVETSQRTVDAILRALALAAPDRIPAASGGSMNNLALGGFDPACAKEFAYYETIACGAGAGPLRTGASAVQTHMTNTWNTPVEALEAAYPLRVVRYAIRRGSGGVGAHRGGDGVEREIEALAPMRVTLLTDRRRTRAYGLAGGGEGKSGENWLYPSRGDRRGRKLEGKTSLSLRIGDRIRIRTPGGGGWGRR